MTAHLINKDILSARGGRQPSKYEQFGCCVWAGLAVCHECRLSTTVRNCTRDEGGPFEVGNQVLISSHRKLLWSKAMVVLCQEERHAV